jgi:hypothetical protein
VTAPEEGDAPRYRTGRHNPQIVYLQEGDEPAKGNPMVCVVWPPFTGIQIAAALNTTAPDMPPAERNTPDDVRATAFNAVGPALQTHGDALRPGVRQAVADAVLAALDAAGYRIVKDAAPRYGIRFTGDSPHSDEVYENAFTYDDDVALVVRPDNAVHLAAMMASEGYPGEVVQRHVGSWTPVDEETRTDG